MTVMAEKPSYTLQQLHPHSRYRIGVAARTETGAGERVTREVQVKKLAGILDLIRKEMADNMIMPRGFSRTYKRRK